MTLLAARNRLWVPSSMPNRLKQGLVGAWPLDEASGNRRDVSGLGNTLIDNATVTGNPGPSIYIPLASQFTAANSEYLSIADNALLSMGDIEFTIACFFYADSLPVGNFSGLVTKGNYNV